MKRILIAGLALGLSGGMTLGLSGCTNPPAPAVAAKATNLPAQPGVCDASAVTGKTGQLASGYSTEGCGN